MGFIDIRVYEHASVPKDEAWFVRRKDSGEVPPDLRPRIRVPCILTGDAARLGESLTLLHIAQAYAASGA